MRVLWVKKKKKKKFGKQHSSDDIYKRGLLGHKVNEAKAQICSYKKSNKFFGQEPFRRSRLENLEKLIADAISYSPGIYVHLYYNIKLRFFYF